MNLLLALLLATTAAAPSTPAPPEPAQLPATEIPPAPATQLRAFDTPNDAGRSITLQWKPSPSQDIDGYIIQRAIVRAGQLKFDSLDYLPPGRQQYVDEQTADSLQYIYRILTLRGPAQTPADSKPARSRPQLFNLDLLNILVAMAIVFFFILYFIYHARKGKQLFIRRIAGLDAVEEAVGRATEMGRPILFVPGIGGVSDIATISSLNILGEIAKKTAQYSTDLIVPNRDPIVFPIAREFVKEAHTKVGRPDTFKPDNIFFITQEQFAYAAAVDGIMVRDKPATNFLLGIFYAESLILAETGAMVGAIQIAGTDQITQLPFFITACDYTLIGEELYAASAYLAREPLLLGSLVGQDYGKLAIIITVVLGSALYLLSTIKGLNWLAIIGQLLRT
jgi:hypothetical protein